MKLRINDRQRSVGIMIIWIFTICLLIGIAIWRFSALTAILRKILSVLAPIIWGLVIAYLLTPMKNWLEKQAVTPTARPEESTGLKRLFRKISA